MSLVTSTNAGKAAGSVWSSIWRERKREREIVRERERERRERKRKCVCVSEREIWRENHMPGTLPAAFGAASARARI